MAVDHCSADSTFAGIVRILDEIRRNRPHAKIVVSSVLPVRISEFETRIELEDSITWQEANAVNRRLQCFTSAMEGVHFFNASEAFSTDSRVDSDEILQSAQSPEAPVKTALKSVVGKVLDVINA